MHYDQYHEGGMKFGSGVIESKCKQLVALRTKKLGSRWSSTGANSLLALQSCAMNNQIADFQYWKVN